MRVTACTSGYFIISDAAAGLGNPGGEAKARDRALRAALKLLEKAKLRHVHVRSHRAVSRLPIGFFLLLQAVVLPVLFCGALIWAEPQLLWFWRECILFWAGLLDIPLQASGPATGVRQLGLSWTPTGNSLHLPGADLLLVTAAATCLALLGSFQMKGRRLPLRYLLRILCAVQALALLFFWLAPAQFPYTVSSHLLDLVSIGYLLVIATPVMLAFGYYVLDVSIAAKISHTLLILAYFVVMIPHQVVLHTLILQHFSLLFMPILYLCFGTLFDVLIFVALYSWAASAMPPQAVALPGFSDRRTGPRPLIPR